MSHVLDNNIKIQDDLVKLKKQAKKQLSRHTQFCQVFQTIGFGKPSNKIKTILAAKHLVDKAIQFLTSLPFLTATGYLDRHQGLSPTQDLTLLPTATHVSPLWPCSEGRNDRYDRICGKSRLGTPY